MAEFNGKLTHLVLRIPSFYTEFVYKMFITLPQLTSNVCLHHILFDFFCFWLLCSSVFQTLSFSDLNFQVKKQT